MSSVPEVKLTSYEDERTAELRELYRQRIFDATPVRYRDIDAPTETAAWREAMIAGKASNLVMVGPTGTGKTCAVWTTLRALHEDGWLVAGYPGTWKYWRATDLAAALRPNADVEDTIDRARKVALLIIDDLGSATLTDWQREQLTRIFDSRWENNRPVVLTSNLPKLRDILDDRLASRLQDGATIVTLRGADRRREDNPEVPTAWTTAAEKRAFTERINTVQW